jgi:hypothetical protein
MWCYTFCKKSKIYQDAFVNEENKIIFQRPNLEQLQLNLDSFQKIAHGAEIWTLNS